MTVLCYMVSVKSFLTTAETCSPSQVIFNALGLPWSSSWTTNDPVRKKCEGRLANMFSHRTRLQQLQLAQPSHWSTKLTWRSLAWMSLERGLWTIIGSVFVKSALAHCDLRKLNKCRVLYRCSAEFLFLIYFWSGNDIIDILTFNYYYV